jgi:SsrA-binding protein
MSKHNNEILITNKKANFDFETLQNFQAGLSLSGGMVKEIREKKVHLQGKYIVWQSHQLQVIGFGNDKINQNVTLLLSKKEIKKIVGQLSTKGVSCILLNLKKVGRWLKADIALVKGKKEYDKRETIKKRDLDREARRDY